MKRSPCPHPNGAPTRTPLHVIYFPVTNTPFPYLFLLSCFLRSWLYYRYCCYTISKSTTAAVPTSTFLPHSFLLACFLRSWLYHHYYYCCCTIFIIHKCFPPLRRFHSHICSWRFNYCYCNYFSCCCEILPHLILPCLPLCSYTIPLSQIFFSLSP